MPSPSEIQRAIAANKHNAVMCRARIRALQYSALRKALKEAVRTGHGQNLPHFPQDFKHYGALVSIYKQSYDHCLCLNY